VVIVEAGVGLGREGTLAVAFRLFYLVLLWGKRQQKMKARRDVMG